VGGTFAKKEEQGGGTGKKRSQNEDDNTRGGTTSRGTGTFNGKDGEELCFLIRLKKGKHKGRMGRRGTGKGKEESGA